MRNLVIALASTVASANAAVAQAPASLQGLWAAKERYGPDIRGTLMIVQRGDGLVADIAGFTAPVQQQGSHLSFELPDGRGSFRGLRGRSGIEGQ